MSLMSPQIGEFLIKATHLPDIDAALKKVLTEYIELKTADIGGKINKSFVAVSAERSLFKT